MKKSRYPHRSIHLPAIGLGLLMLVTARVTPAGDTICNSIGPDVIVGEIPATQNWGVINGIRGYTIATTSCNIGDEVLDWVADTDQHPVIAQHMFRLKDSRFEQIGQSWLKHGWGALQGNDCGCGCTPADYQHLGTGCSDPYGAGSNGSQAYMGPKWEINPYTGQFPYPHAEYGSSGNAIYKRLQVHEEDLEENTNKGAQYFVEAQYIHPDDSALMNSFNNASWREVSIDEDHDLHVLGITQREQPAIIAWALHDSNVYLRTIDIPYDGRLLLGWSVNSLGDGTWEYEFALQNLNSERGVGGFIVDLPADAAIEDIGFHDVDYHSGDIYESDDWDVFSVGGSLAWRCTPFEDNENANALRWGTLYNFRFRSDVPPEDVPFVELELFKPGNPLSMLVPLVVEPPAHDSCASAQVTGEGTLIVENTGATSSGPDEPGCGTINADVWYLYQYGCGEVGAATFQLCSSSFDSVITIYEGGCPGGPGQALGCTNGTCGTPGITLPADPGDEFLIRVGSSGTDTGTALLAITCGTPLENDECWGAVPVAVGDSPYNSSDATDSFDPPDHGVCPYPFGGSYKDVWFTFLVPQNGLLSMHTCDPDSFDTDLTVYRGTCEDLALIACDGDASGMNGCQSYYSSLSNIEVTAGETLTIRIGGYAPSSSGPGTLHIEYEDGRPPPPITNDECTDALPVFQGDTPFDTTDATSSSVSIPPGSTCGSGFGGVHKDIWCSFQAPGDGLLSLDTCDPDGFDTDLVVYTGTCNDLVLLACDGDGGGMSGCQSYYSSLSDIEVTAGEMLTIRIGGYAPSTSGPGTLHIEYENAPPPPITNDECTGALPVFHGDNAFDATSATNSSDPYDDSLCIGTYLGQLHRDVWFSFQAPGDGLLSLDTCDPDGFDTDLVVYTGTCNDLVLLACNGDAAPSSNCQMYYSSVSDIEITTGETLLIRIGGWGASDSGHGTLHVEFEDICFTDLDGDGVTGMGDLLTLLSDWGPCEECPADLNHDNTVSFLDLVILLSSWGSCP